MSYHNYADPPEPTEEDWCGMSGHDLSRYVNPETGWRECMCGSFIEPCEGEPHDEYSALCINLIEEYTNRIAKTVQGQNEYISIQSSKARINLGRLLAGKPPQYLQSLLNSLKNSRHDNLAEFLHPTAGQLDLAVVLGVHLDNLRAGIVDDMLISMGFGGDQKNETIGVPRPPTPFGMALLSAENIDLARIAAKLCSLLDKPYLRHREYPTTKLLESTCPMLLGRENLLPVVADLCNARGISEVTTQHVLELIRQESGVPAKALLDGLL